MSDRFLSDSEISRQLDQLLGAKEYPLALPDAIHPERDFEHFRLLEKIGSGAFGVVYRAIDGRDQTEVAVKVLRDDVLITEDTKERFELEAFTTGRLQHRGIVRLLSSGLEAERPYIVSELIDGPDLGLWYSAQGHPPQDCDQVLRFLLPLLESLEYAHTQGVIHRDIKPGNVLLRIKERASQKELGLDSFEPVLTDFGLAKVVSQDIVDSRSSLAIGTPMYMAPEQLVPSWGKVSQRTDIYSLGVLMAELLNGTPPRYGMSYMELLGSVLPATKQSHLLWSDHVSNGVRAIVRRCLQVDPIDRYSTIGELRNDVERILCSPNSNQTIEKGPGMFRRWARSPERPIEICFYVITINVILFLWMLFNAVVIAGPLYHGKERVSDILQCIGIAFGCNLLIAGLCILRIYGNRWPMFVALGVTCVVNVFIPLMATLGLMNPFPGLYEKAPFFRLANHAQILLVGLVQAILIGISVFSDHSSKRRSLD